MIQSKKELDFYIKADYMMNRGYFKPSFKQRLKAILSPDYIMDFLITMRRVDYYTQTKQAIPLIINKFKYKKLSIKLGFSIGAEVFGYGLVIPHYGTIVVGENNRIGNYAVLHSSTCITARQKVIGNNFYLSTGAKVTTGENLGDNIMVSANSVVTKGYSQGNVLLVGAPAIIKKTIPSWYEYQGGNTIDKVRAIEKLRMQMGIFQE